MLGRIHVASKMQRIVTTASIVRSENRGRRNRQRDRGAIEMSVESDSSALLPIL
jgi:hypothetical protein